MADREKSGRMPAVHRFAPLKREASQAARMPDREEDFHFLWEHLHFERDHLTGEGGEEIRVLHPGQLNRNQGPDFLDAKIVIDGLTFHGHVELHLNSGEWYQHNHQHDPNYNNVILHVVARSGRQAAHRQDGTLIPELCLGGRLDQEILANIRGLRANAGDLPCQAWLKSPENRLPEGMKAKLGQERLLRKASKLENRIWDLTGDWEQALWEELAATLGGPVNGASFRELAKALPWRVVRKYASGGRQPWPPAAGRSQVNMAAERGVPGLWGIPGMRPPETGQGQGQRGAESNPCPNPHRNQGQGHGQEQEQEQEEHDDAFDLLSLEALLFGTAGMLQEGPRQREPWPLRLRLEWAYLSRKHHLHAIQAPFMFHRMRPGGFPTVRLAQLAGLACRFPDLAVLLDPASWPIFRKCRIEAGRYWREHLRFGEKRRARPRRLGTGFRDLVIVNTLAPLALLYGGYHGHEPEGPAAPGQCLGLAGRIWEKTGALPPEDNLLLRKFSSCGEIAETALEAQGLLELQKEYCAKGRCLQCAFGKQIARGELTPHSSAKGARQEQGEQ